MQDDPNPVEQAVEAVPPRSTPLVHGRHESSWSIVLWVGVLIGVTAVGGWIIMQVRKRMLDSRENAQHEAGLIENLRAMRDRGEISEEEFNATKRQWSERMKERLAAGTSSGGAKASATAPPARSPIRVPAAPGELRARPGFDLTGAPLPPMPPNDAPSSGT